ncbi:MAG TPA: HAD-IIA family hydrolase [Acidimicrobiales bacterium]|nr:HAD-IIA family hydrolase [Acidimicrobiales bacterium]
MAWVLDLDGVVWLGHQVIPGAPEAVARLRAAGERVVFVTNNSSARVGDKEAELEGHGIPASGDVLTSAMAAAWLLEPGSTALVCAGPGVDEALELRGVTAVREGDADAVVVGFHLDFDYGRLLVAHRAVRRGARLVATNDDPTYPTPHGLIPGGGAIVAAVATACGIPAVVAGKPNPPMAALVDDLVGGGPHTVVGDRDDTDGAFARALGARFALVLSGATTAGEVPTDPAPDLVAPDLATLVAAALRG